MNTITNNKESVRSNDVTGTQDINRIAEECITNLKSNKALNKSEPPIDYPNEEDGMYATNIKPQVQSSRPDQPQATQPSSQKAIPEDDEGDGGMPVGPSLGAQSDMMDLPEEV